MTPTHSRAESVTLTAVAATMQAADLETPVAACCRTCRWWNGPHSIYAFFGGPWGQCEPAVSKPAQPVTPHPAHAVQTESGALFSGEAMKGGASLITQADFACNQWQAKESK